MTDDQAHATHQATRAHRPRILAGRYALLNELGRGGMGVVWRAEDQVIGRQVAIKELRLPDGGEAADVFQERVLREVRTGGRLNDPAVVTVYDAITEGEATYIVMELIDAPTLSDLVRERGPLSQDVVAAIGEQVLSALTAAHRAGIVHRDVKPGNIMVTANGRVKLTDFGIAQPVDDPRLTTSGFLVGSPAFMAPERVAGKEARAASDLWSLGVTLYFAVEGTIAFERGTTAATLHAIMNEVPYLTRAQGPLASAIMGMLISTPEARITAEQAQGLLAMARTGTGVPTPPNGQFTALYPGGGQPPTLYGSAPNIPRPKPKRKLALIAGAVLAVAALVGGVFLGMWLAGSSDGKREPTWTYGPGGDMPQEFSLREGSCAKGPLEKSREYGNPDSCDDPHDIEVFDVAEPFSNEKDENPVAYRGDELVAWAQTRCGLTFHSDLIDADKRDQVSYRTLVPSKQAWEVTKTDEIIPARAIYCVAFKTEGGQLTGSVFAPDE